MSFKVYSKSMMRFSDKSIEISWSTHSHAMLPYMSHESQKEHATFIYLVFNIDWFTKLFQMYVISGCPHVILFHFLIYLLCNCSYASGLPCYMLFSDVHRYVSFKTQHVCRYTLSAFKFWHCDRDVDQRFMETNILVHAAIYWIFKDDQNELCFRRCTDACMLVT